MIVLSLNPGSGTLLYKLLAMPAGAEPRDGEVLKEGKIDHVHGDATIHATEQAVTACLPLGIEAIGFRVVHGGTRFDKPARITPDVSEAIRSLSELAPLHNPIDFSIIEAVSRRVPDVAVFDTDRNGDHSQISTGVRRSDHPGPSCSVASSRMRKGGRLRKVRRIKGSETL
jgi:acetate kinase